MPWCFIHTIYQACILNCRTERIEGLIEEIKSNDKKLQVMNADIAVMKLLLGVPVEETEEKTGK